MSALLQELEVSAAGARPVRAAPVGGGRADRPGRDDRLGARNGVWLLFWLAAPGAVGISRAGVVSRPWAAIAIAAAAGMLLCLSVARGPVAYAPGPRLVAQAITLSHGSPILAGGGVDEQIAVAGGRIWAGDPIDAFSSADQASYLDWLGGQRGGLRALTDVRVVLAQRGTPAAQLTASDPGFVAVGRDAEGVLFSRITR